MNKRQTLREVRALKRAFKQLNEALDSVISPQKKSNKKTA